MSHTTEPCVPAQPEEHEQPAEETSTETPEHPGDDELVREELLVEDVSIDGMCGVY